ncbi:MAG: hypothetical protein ACKV0T_07280 [Planctomycetales bacterium]
MASTRADEVAEILWELKRAGKLSTYTHIARRAGFSAGTNGRAMDSCLKVIRRDWPHLHWWRAVRDDKVVEPGCEQETCLRAAGFELEAHANGKQVLLVSVEEHLLTWEIPAEVEAVPAAE